MKGGSGNSDAARLASLRAAADEASTIAEAFERAARQHRVDESHYRSQIATIERSIVVEGDINESVPIPTISVHVDRSQDGETR